MGGNNLAGPLGEDKAAEFLKKNGYTILKRNYRTIGIEIDIIAQTGNTICFVEVKTRKSDRYGRPEEYVSSKKRKRYMTAASIFSSQKKYSRFFLRFDIISITYQSGSIHINHIVNAYED